VRLWAFDPHVSSQNLHFYVGTVALLWDAGAGRLTRMILFSIATCFFLIGAWKTVRERLEITTLFCLGYGLFIIALPFQSARYLLPLLPEYMYLVLRGSGEVRACIARRSPAAAKVVAGALVSAVFSAYAGQLRASRFAPRPYTWDGLASNQLYDFARAAMPKDAVFIAGGARALALYSGRRAARYPDNLDRSFVTKYIRDVGATYLVESRTDRGAWRLLCHSMSGMHPVFSNSDYTVYRIDLASSDL